MAKKKAPTKPEMVLNIILDESGSMDSVREKTVEGLNEYLGGLLDDPNATYLATLTKFDSYPGDPTCRIQYKLKGLKGVGPMNLEDYNPRGSTPLLDAVGITIREVEKDCGDRSVLTIIITDGFENSSVEFKKETIQKMIKDKQDSGKWTFVYLGADQNAWANSAALGIPAGNSMSYNSANTHALYAAMANVTMARSANLRHHNLGATAQCFADSGLSNKSLEDNLNQTIIPPATYHPTISTTGQLSTPDITTVIKNAVSNRARTGGVARAQSQTATERKELAQKAARARWGR